MELDDDDYGPAGASSDPVAAEVMQRYGRSGQPDSQAVVAILKAVQDVVAAEGLQLSPTSYFAAIMAALEKPETQASQQVWAEGRKACACGDESPAAAWGLVWVPGPLQTGCRRTAPAWLPEAQASQSSSASCGQGGPSKAQRA
jgi:hypothetical protein